MTENSDDDFKTPKKKIFGSVLRVVLLGMVLLIALGCTAAFVALVALNKGLPNIEALKERKYCNMCERFMLLMNSKTKICL